LRGPQRDAVRSDPVRLRSRAAGLGRIAVVHRLVHPQAAPSLHTFPGMSTPDTATLPKPKRSRLPKLPRPRLPRRERDELRPEEMVPWSPLDRIGVAAAWFCGLLLIALSASIVIYMLVRGLQYLSIGALFEHPVSLSTTSITSTGGGYLDPIEGTLILTALGTLIALPIGGATAVWLRVDGRHARLAGAVAACC